MAEKKSWSELTATQQLLIVVLGSVQVGLAISAWVDLAKRPAAQVVGSKAAWAAVIAIDVVGPVLYFTRGRRR